MHIDYTITQPHNPYLLIAIVVQHDRLNNVCEDGQFRKKQ